MFWMALFSLFLSRIVCLGIQISQICNNAYNKSVKISATGTLYNIKYCLLRRPHINKTSETFVKFYLE